MARLAPTKYT